MLRAVEYGQQAWLDGVSFLPFVCIGDLDWRKEMAAFPANCRD